MVDPEILWQHLVEDTGRGQTKQTKQCRKVG